MKPAFVVIWKSPMMAAPAFWYFATREYAEHVASTFRPLVTTRVEPSEVPDDFDLEDAQC